MAVRVFKGTEVDAVGAEDMVRLQKAALSAGAMGHYQPDDLAEWLDCIKPACYLKMPPTFKVFIYLDSLRSDDSEFLTGFAVVGTRTGRLIALYVHPAHWRRGVGRALLKSAQPWIKTVESSLNAVPFFEACGMSCSGDSLCGLKYARLSWQERARPAKRPLDLGSEQVPDVRSQRSRRRAEKKRNETALDL